MGYTMNIDLVLHVFELIEKCINKLKNSENKELIKNVLDKINNDKEYINNNYNKQSGIINILTYLENNCLIPEGVDAVVSLLLKPIKKKPSKTGKHIVKSHKGGSGLEVYAVAALGAAAAWYILNNNFCKWYPDKCTKEADGTIKEPTPEEKEKIINEMCINPDNSFMKVACLGATEKPEKVIIQNNN